MIGLRPLRELARVGVHGLQSLASEEDQGFAVRGQACQVLVAMAEAQGSQPCECRGRQRVAVGIERWPGELLGLWRPSVGRRKCEGTDAQGDRKAKGEMAHGWRPPGIARRE